MKKDSDKNSTTRALELLSEVSTRRLNPVTAEQYRNKTLICVESFGYVKENVQLYLGLRNDFLYDAFVRRVDEEKKFLRPMWSLKWNLPACSMLFYGETELMRCKSKNDDKHREQLNKWLGFLYFIKYLNPF